MKLANDFWGFFMNPPSSDACSLVVSDHSRGLASSVSRYSCIRSEKHLNLTVAPRAGCHEPDVHAVAGVNMHVQTQKAYCWAGTTRGTTASLRPADDVQQF